METGADGTFSGSRGHGGKSPALPSESWLAQAPVLVVIAGILCLGGWLWIANQGGLVDPAPRKIAANVWLILRAMPSLAAIWLAAAGWGYPVRRWMLGEGEDRLVMQVAVGLAIAFMGQYMLGLVGLLGAVWTLGLMGLGLALLIWQIVEWALAQRGQLSGLTLPTQNLWLAWSTVWMMPGVGLMLVAGASPPGSRWHVEAYGYDVLSYHLQLPREWLAAGRVMGFDHNVYSFLPDMMESVYAGIGAVHGSMLDAIYTCQFFHVSLAIFTAIILATIVHRFVGVLAAGATGAIFLSLPWTIITGSLAYTEMGMLAFAGAALLVMSDWRSDRPSVAAVIGFLLAMATLCKLTAGPMLAVPLGLLILCRLSPLLRWRKPPSWKRARNAFAVATLAGLISLSPYFVRNSAQTGNPVFPFAVDLFGTGHWTQSMDDRWQAAHGLQAAGGWAQRLGISAWSDLARQWPYNTGYGAVGGQTVQSKVTEIARFDYQWGFPLMGVAMLLGAAMAVGPGITRRLTGALGLVLLVQVGFWLLFTEHPSRYLIPTLLPACLLVGLGIGRLSERSRWLRLGGAIVCLALPVVLVTVSLGVFWRQSRPIKIRGQNAPWAWVDSLDRPGHGGLIGRHPINKLPRHSRTLVVGDNGSLLYLRRPFDYTSAFDAGPLTHIIGSLRESGVDHPLNHRQQITAQLRQRGYTHLWMGWSELDRINQSFGALGPMNVKNMRRLSAHWQPVYKSEQATLFRLPSK